MIPVRLPKAWGRGEGWEGPCCKVLICGCKQLKPFIKHGKKAGNWECIETFGMAKHLKTEVGGKRGVGR